jgi:16S rRNA (guanine(527)-N(7))-methyltransferase RsmG
MIPPHRSLAVVAPTHEHVSALTLLGVPGARRDALAQYLDLVSFWNERTNLTGARTSEERVDVLIADAWAAHGVIAPGRLLDVGSGNGSPGLVLALLRQDVTATLLEPRARRWAFLREAVRTLGRPDIEVVRGRFEDYPGPPVRTVTLRAVAANLAELERLLEPGGEVVVFGGQPSAGEGLTLASRHPLAHAELHVFRRPAPNVSRET